MTDYNAFKAFCEANNFQVTDIEARKAYQASQSNDGEKVSKRKHERKHITMLCIARNEVGELLFKRATVPNIKSVKEHTAWVLQGEAIEAGNVSAYCVIASDPVEC